MKTEPMQLQFYTKSDCPLCDEAKSVLNRIEAKLSYITVEEIDITKNIGLFSKYKLLIPVLELDGKHLVSQRIDAKKLLWKLRWFWLRNRFC